MKIVTIIGARPQFVKAATLSRVIAKDKTFKELIVHTGQHFDANMSNVFFEEMEIPKPDYHLEINSMSHGAMTGRMLEEIEKVLIKEQPDWVLVYRDTNSTLAGALAAKKLHIKLAHVEAGLRSFNMKMPEEINRILTDRISDILFCPTDTAVTNLEKEGYQYIDCKIEKVGDVMLDAALYYAKSATDKSTIIKDLSIDNFILCTLHRAENTDNIDNLRAIFDALNQINEEQMIILPLHPRTKKIIEENSIKCNVKIISPVGYFDMIELLKHCSLVMTDSGGLQKEAFFFKKPCITLREQTEWIELLEAGVNSIVGSDTNKILEAYHKSRDNNIDFNKHLYGNGDAANKILDLLKQYSN